MKSEITDALWLDERHELTLAELADLSGLSADELRELVECDALLPMNPAAPAATFSAECLVVARTACRLRDDFDLDADALAVVLRLLARIRGLEAELRAARAQLPTLHR